MRRRAIRGSTMGSFLFLSLTDGCSSMEDVNVPSKSSCVSPEKLISSSGKPVSPDERWGEGMPSSEGAGISGGLSKGVLVGFLLSTPWWTEVLSDDRRATSDSIFSSRSWGKDSRSASVLSSLVILDSRSTIELLMISSLVEFISMVFSMWTRWSSRLFSLRVRTVRSSVGGGHVALRSAWSHFCRGCVFLRGRSTVGSGSRAFFNNLLLVFFLFREMCSHIFIFSTEEKLNFTDRTLLYICLDL